MASEEQKQRARELDVAFPAGISGDALDEKLRTREDGKTSGRR